MFTGLLLWRGVLSWFMVEGTVLVWCLPIDRSDCEGVEIMKLGIVGYTTCWTLGWWLGGTPWGVIPALFIALPIAHGVQGVIDRIKGRN